MSTVAGGSVPAFFYKDGRKVSVGDCALFKPPQDSPPLVGIICSIKLSKEYILELCVNWLYWPTEVKLGKGIPLEAAPNEVIYSFHKDEIPAASLLHPCKIAFLPKGVELPSGISAFICRRVYDIANKCLWWLTDQEYIDEQQEEVEQLLNKTRIEMYATVQSGGRSAKLVNGPTSQLKLGSDKVQSSTSFPSHAKGKKRERADHGSEPVKKECYAKMDDGNSIQFKSESLKAEISKITEKGGLVDSGGVEKLVQLMQPDRSERKMEVVRPSMLAGVIATTENFECLDRFVHLKGSLVLDEWLQDVHKGKIGDSSPKDGDKSVEEFLFVSLRALDKLTGNLQALQICNISKSVNRLCSHKNFEIQKKARSLVDTWKKRVDAEMNVIDAHSRSCLPEVSHGGSRHPGGASDIAIKSTIPEPVSNISPNGRFRCIISGWQRGELLGRGSFGSVYEGIADGGFFFAVKEVSLLDKSYLGRQSIYQLKQEIAFLSQFEHKNIVQYYGTDKDESNLYIFLELATMGSLLSIYRKYDLGDYRVSSYTRQILHGLKYLHERDVVHRDIKCANILVDANGSVKLADFGLAKTTKLNDVKSCKGTVFWMAPEVVKRENENDGYGLAADIWSLGCTVLELLTRQIPYSDLEWGQALFRIGRGHPPPVPDSLSRDARDFILECLKVDPKARPTAAQLLDHPFVRRSLPPSSGLSSPYHPARRI